MKPSFSAALLAGGQSTRMGRDKALLEFPNSSRLLWQRQLDVIEELQPQQIFWSGPARSGLPGHLHLVDDAIKSAGPLAGISACLDRCTSDLLVVLAIDLPQMTASFLQGLLAKCSPGCGAVARRDTFFEPLAAVYPLQVATLATAQLKAGRYSMHDFIREAVSRKRLQPVPLEEHDYPLFKNFNEPGDWAGIEKSCN